MFNSLTGTVTGKYPQKLFLDTHGIEWDLNVPDTTLDKIADVGSEARVYTWMQHTDALMLLYGFATETDRRLFLDLLNGRFRRLVVFQFDDYRRNVRNVWNQGEVGIAFARRQFLDDRVFQVGVEIGQADGTLEGGLVVVGQRVGGARMGLGQGGGHGFLVLVDGGF